MIFAAGLPRREGMIAKDPRSAYRSGSTRAWAKVKVRHEGVFYVGGIRNVDASMAWWARRIDGALHFRGVVEWGFKAHDVLALPQHARDFRMRLSPFVDALWMCNAVWLSRGFAPK
jgi:ATP-dependent DNA ligase